MYTMVSKTGVLGLGKIKIGGMENKKVHVLVYTEANPMVIARPVAGIQETGKLTKERDNDPMPCINCNDKCKQDMECDLFVDWLARQEPVAGGR